MEKIITIFLTDAKIDRDNVLHLLDCREDSPVYDDVMEDYKEVESAFYTLAKPETRMLFDEIPPELSNDNLPPGTKVVYLIHTIGSDASTYCTEAFKKNDYLKAMLMDAMSSSLLFEMDKLIQDCLKTECAQKGVGILRRLEAPRDIPMLAQKVACDKLFSKEHPGVRTSSAFMLDPPKSNCVIFVLTDNKEILHTEQDCQGCTAENCPMRKTAPVAVTVVLKESTHVIRCNAKESLLGALRKHKLYSSAACGGTGKCGKCKVQFREGVIEATYADRTHFSQSELDKGMRLACQAFPMEDCTITLHFQDESTFEILTDSTFFDAPAAQLPQERYAIAVDIGTTTIAAALVGLESRLPAAFYTTLNRQRMYGADVISRILASNEGKKEQLQKSIREDILLCIRNLVEENKIDKRHIEKMVLAGNTTMGHLLRGYPCTSLGVSPFTPVSTAQEEHSFGEMLDSDYLECTVILFPGISTFVGGDIVSGLLSCGFPAEEKTALFIDLGTNGEMAVGNKNKILATSTAAGPAFEGGNILWGTGSVKGAICSVTIDGDNVHTETIGNGQPAGICGTGIIEVMAELLKTGIIDETGLLEDRYFKTGFPLAMTADGEQILVTQRDVREIQLAKSAVRAGIEVLLKRYGKAYGDIDTVWLAGGFGVKIDQNKAIAIGMIPEEFRGKIRAVGNSSLSGAIRYCIEESESVGIVQIVANAAEINLSNDKDFNQLYVDYMFF